MKINIGEKIRILRKERKITQKELAQALDTSASAIGMYEQNRREPDNATIIKLAQFFRVSSDYLLGLSELPRAPFIPFSDHELKVIDAYRSQPEIQPAVDRLLGIEAEGKILLWSAADSSNNEQRRIIYMEKERWDKLKNTPETDDPLI